MTRPVAYTKNYGDWTKGLIMNEASNEQPPRFRFSKLFWIGVVIFAVGCGPLLATGLLATLGLTKDPNPNPVVFLLLAMFTFLPSVAFILAGFVISIIRYSLARKRFNHHMAKQR